MDADAPDEDAHTAPARAETMRDQGPWSTDRATALTLLFESVHQGIYVGTLGRDGSNTLAANPHLKVIFGYAAGTADADVVPFAPDRFVDPGARTAFIDELEREGHVDDHLLRLRRVDGSLAWMEVTAVSDPRLPGSTLALVRDVSDRKRLDDQSRELHHQLLQAEKMAALGQTISGVAHELNNPLATILSWAERLADRPADEKTRQGLDVIRGESERAARIVRSLLTFARKRQTTRMMVDINELVHETLALRAYEQRVTNIDVTQRLAPDLPEVFADGYQIKQVILNLLINAEQAMLAAHGRGSLAVRSWHDPTRNSVIVEVNDDGPGIPEELQGKVFDPFYTTKEVGKGTGLGLSVAYAIVQEHNGRIWVASQRGAGASFFVELPVATLPLATSTPAAGRGPEGAIAVDAFKGLRVLVVEDEPALASAVSEALEDAGFVVERASNGEEGLTAVGHHAYDLVVCDLKMPKIDGIQFYRAMAAATPGLARRVIFVTGAVAGTDAELFLEETGCRWLSKPFRLGDLLRAARDTLS